MKSLDKLLDDLETAHVRAMNANTRALQYAGFATGTKARERAEHWQEKFDATLNETRDAMRSEKAKLLAALQPFSGLDAEGKPQLRWLSESALLDAAKNAAAAICKAA